MAEPEESSEATRPERPAGIPRRSAAPALAALGAVIAHDGARFARHYGRALGALLFPVLLLLVVPAGFNGVFGRALAEPYGTYVTLADYLVPGCVGLVLFLTAVPLMATLLRDRDNDAIQLMLVVPLPRWFVVFARFVAAALLATFQAVIFLVIARLIGSDIEIAGWLVALPAEILAAFTLAAASFLLVLVFRRLWRFSTMLLFVVLPVFVLSSALYPLWKFTDFGADYLNVIAEANPFTHAVELIRYASEGQLEPVSLLVVVGVGAAAFLGVMAALSPRFGLLTRRPRPGAWAEPATE